MSGTPSSWEDYLERAVREFDKGNWDKAIAEYTKAIELKPAHASLWVGRGGAYINIREYDRGLADLDKGIALDPKNGLAYASQPRV